MFAFDTVNGGLDDLAVSDVYLAVTVEVVHPTVPIIVDEDVGGISVHVATQTRASACVAAARVVLWCAESAHHLHAVRTMAALLEVEKHELELVHQAHVEHEVLRPHGLLTLRQKIAKREVV